MKTPLIFDAYLLAAALALLATGACLAWPLAHRAGARSVAAAIPPAAPADHAPPVRSAAGPALVVRRPGTHRLTWRASVALWWASTWTGARA